jgi:glycosyltransferase 2 family protein
MTEKGDEPIGIRETTIPWGRIGLSLLISGLLLWLLTRNLAWGDVLAALLNAKPGYVLFSTAIMLLTLLLKGWRWQMLFYPNQDRARWYPTFAAMMIGQLFNLLIPARIGELARIYTFHQQTGLGKARALGTLVVEKSVDLIMLLATLLLVLPFLVIPELSRHRGTLLTAVALSACLLIYLLVYQAQPLVRLLRRLAERLPAAIGSRIINLALAGLQGLSALRNRRVTLILLLYSAVIALLAVITPWVLFPAFGLQLGLREAAILHLVLTAGLTPPSTPGKILLFEGLVVFTLQQFGPADNATLLSYAILFHLVVMLPQILLGSLAAMTSKWDWRQPATPVT